jgi:hypothetical protein
MSFAIIGDVIEFDGHAVADFRRDVFPTVRATVVNVITDIIDPDDDSLHENCDGEIAELKKQIDDLEEDRARLETKLDEALTQRDAYAALLGVK